MVEKMKLYRSVRDKRFTGLCGGLAETFNVDATVLRLVVLIAAFFSAGTVLLIYILASIVVPKETDLYKGGPNDPYSDPYKDPYRDSYRDPYEKNDFRHKRPQYKEEPKEATPNIDDMMEDIEKKAMWKEIEELRAKLAEFEKEKGDK